MPKSRPIASQPLVVNSDVVPINPQPVVPNSNSAHQPSIILPNLENVPSVSTGVLLQKRRRVTRACDECRKKKVKCDGNLPCIHCTVYSHECTYDHPTNRNATKKKPNTRQVAGPAATNTNNHSNNKPSSSLLASGISPQMIQKMTNRLRLYDDILKRLLPDIKLTDANDKPIPINPVKLMAALNELDEEDHSSEDISRERLIAQKYESLPNVPVPPIPTLSSGPPSVIGSAASTVQITSSAPSPGNNGTNSPSDDGGMGREIKIILPSREIALQLITKTWENACVLFRFYHRPAFIEDLNELYDTDPSQYSNKQQRFLPLVYSVMACGALFYKSDKHTNGGKTDDDQLDDEFKDEGYRYFIAARKLIDITDTRDTYGIQTIVMLIIFLQCSARLSTCYAYIGIALRAALREGLHRQLDYPFNPIELEIRKRLFWTIYKMDIYVNTMLGLPRTISEDDFDQEMPLELDDENITVDCYRFDRQGDRLSSSGIANAHTRLIFIMKQIVTKLYPIKSTKLGSSREPELLAHDIVYELELELQDWMNSLPLELKPGVEPSSQYLKANRLLHISYLHVKIILYRPFIHYISADFARRKNSSYDLKCMEKAKNCINVARIVVKLAEDMIKKNMLSGSYWFSIYTIFFSVACLVYYVHFAPPINRNGNFDPEYIAIKNDAENGKRVLDILKDSSQAARRTYNILNALFEQLNRKTARASINHDVELQNPQFVTPQVGKSQLEKEQAYVKSEIMSGSNTNANNNSSKNSMGAGKSSASNSSSVPPNLNFNQRPSADSPVDLSAFQANYVPSPAIPKMDNDKINKIVNGVNFIDGVSTGINLNVSYDDDDRSSSNPNYGNPTYQGNENDSTLDDKKYVPGIMDQLDMKIFGRFLPPYMLNSNHETTVHSRETSPSQQGFNFDNNVNLSSVNQSGRNDMNLDMSNNNSNNDRNRNSNNHGNVYTSMDSNNMGSSNLQSANKVQNNSRPLQSSNVGELHHVSQNNTSNNDSQLNQLSQGAGFFENINAIPSGLSTVVQSSNNTSSLPNSYGNSSNDREYIEDDENIAKKGDSSEESSTINNNTNPGSNASAPGRERMNSYNSGYDFDEFFFNDWTIGGEPGDFGAKDTGIN